MYDNETIKIVNIIVDNVNCTFEVGKECWHPDIKLTEKGKIVLIVLYIDERGEAKVTMELDSGIIVRFFGNVVRMVSVENLDIC